MRAIYIETMAELCKLHGIKVVYSSILPVSNYHAKPEDWLEEFDISGIARFLPGGRSALPAL